MHRHWDPAGPSEKVAKRGLFFLSYRQTARNDHRLAYTKITATVCVQDQAELVQILSRIEWNLLRVSWSECDWLE